MEYKIIAGGWVIAELERLVAVCLDSGFVPLGGVAMGSHGYVQAMIKYTLDDTV